jgi:hypothetical protein
MFKCLIIGHTYVDSAVDLRRRFAEHLQNWSSSLHLQNATKRYGYLSFSFIVLVTWEPPGLRPGGSQLWIGLIQDTTFF